jgi:hypothetical protein
MLELYTRDPNQIIEHLKEGEAMRAEPQGPDMAFLIMPVDEMIAEFVVDRCLITAAALRPGVGRFLHDLEFGHYPIDDPKNDLMQLWNWRFMGIVWVAVTIPAADEPIAVQVARANKLHLDPHIPILVVNGRDVDFPIRRGNHLVQIPGTTMYGIRDPAL